MRWAPLVALAVYGTARGAAIIILSRWYGRTVG